ncbi:MAG: GDP-fucose synthetase [Spirochaetes bacterium GWF1_41_5]|nr:MAG: GDP-fucose synthetase [Spirochaetes bacterium GWF1_41_5]HBE01001.1 GDP-fucose synthetase [Spirochaetia bacterium]
MKKHEKIFIAGHKGMAGSAILRLLEKEGYDNLILADKQTLDLRHFDSVNAFYENHKPDYIIMAAAKVGGIKINSEQPAVFLYDNLAIQNNLIHCAYLHKVKKVCFLGSSCIYPRECKQPMKEEYLLTGPLEPTNEGYAIAKIAGLKLAEYYYRQYGLCCISLMPCNLYGPNDSFDLDKSHVLSALVRRFSDAHDEKKQEITLWGTGAARREFMHVDDMARAVLFFLLNYNAPSFINVGTGTDVSIKELAELIAVKTGYQGKILWDTSKPDGMMRKRLDVSRMIQSGFSTHISLNEGINQMLDIYKKIKFSGENS